MNLNDVLDNFFQKLKFQKTFHCSDFLFFSQILLGQKFLKRYLGVRFCVFQKKPLRLKFLLINQIPENANRK